MEEARQRIGDPFTSSPLPVHALRPECGRAIGVSKCCGVGAGGRPRHSSWGAHSLGTSPPACVVPQGVPRGRAHREVTRASWCGPPLLQLTPPCTGGGGLFAHKFASFPRTTRPATHPPFPRRFPGRASTEPLCTRVAADACECRLCPDLATCVVAHSQHGAWRARSCARVYGTAE